MTDKPLMKSEEQVRRRLAAEMMALITDPSLEENEFLEGVIGQFNRFIKEASPRFWAMENVAREEKYYRGPKEGQ